MTGVQHPASYRDPAGFIFTWNEVLYRAVQPVYEPAYRHLMDSGLYEKLTAKGWLIPHEEITDLSLEFNGYKLLKPKALSIWSYPYEWSFGQLKDAALLTLKLAIAGLEQGMILKDATAYNIQFLEGKPILIDSLSYDLYEEGKPWQAFRQFCDHFLNPLLIMQAFPQLNPAFLMAYPDGLSPALTAQMLPWKKRLSLNHQLYVYLAASTAKSGSGSKAHVLPKIKILQNLNQLKDFIGKLKLKPAKSTWNTYYEETILSQEYLANKETVVRSILTSIKPKRITDVGCNTGAFSIIASEVAEEVIALDSDVRSVERLYQLGKSNIYLFVADITNPTPSLGWANEERSTLMARIGGDAVLALALIHHLALAKNVPLPFISKLFADITSDWLLIEFVPKEDPKSQLLLAGKGDIFPSYTQEDFEAAFETYFTTEQRVAMQPTDRTLYVMRKK